MTTASPVRQPVLVDVEALVLDPALQCRVQVVPEVVEAYADVMRDGSGAFPPINVVRDEADRLLVVDGWHRVHAAKSASVAQVLAHVTDGTAREALLMAVRANSDHGLQRTQADRRRAVVVLL